jgi:glyoxylase-like metal-dependent hydrolase (beta-lactamase superfamily II)
MSRPEWEHWSNATDRMGGPRSADLAALADRVEVTDGAASVVPGISIIPTPGHTPGHSSFLVESGRQRAVVLGDAIHCPIQITAPEWGFAQDANPDAARAARQVLLRELEQPETVVAGAHFPNAIFGRVLPGEVPHRVAFDVAPPAPLQTLEAEAPPGSFRLPALAS